MAITKKTIKNLTGGISQQPDANRHDNQCTNQINFLSDPIKGLTKRGGTKAIKSFSHYGVTVDTNVTPYLDVYTGSDAHTQVAAKDCTSAVIPHPLTVEGEDEDKKALLTISNDGKMVCHDLETGDRIGIYYTGAGDGAEISPTETYAGLGGYMALNDHSNYKGTKFAIRTVADTTFIINKAAEVKIATSPVEAAGPARGLIFIKEGAYNSEYTCTVEDRDGDVRTIRVKTSDGTDKSVDSKTSLVAFIIAECIKMSNGFTGSDTVTKTSVFDGSTWSSRGLTEDTAISVTVSGSGFESTEFRTGAGAVKQEGSVIVVYGQYAQYDDSSFYNLPVTMADSYGDTMTEAWNSEAETFAGLPLTCVHGYKLKIKGNPESKLDDYYVNFVGNSEDSVDVQGGSWQECATDQNYEEDTTTTVKKGLDVQTLPHKIIPMEIENESAGYRYLQFSRPTWDDRECGDERTNPFPQFVGKGINDLFYFKNRLGFCSGSTITLTEQDGPFNFFRTTVAQLLPSDRLSIESNEEGHVRLNYAVPFANQMVVFSDNNQFIINYGPEGLTPGATSLTSIGTYDNSPDVRPVALDNSIIFAQEKSGYADIYEMYPTGQGATSFEAQSIAEQVPTLIKGKPVSIAVSSLARTVMVRSDDDYSKIFVYKYYTKGRDRIQSAWMTYEMNTTAVKALMYVDALCYLVTSREDSSDFTPSTDYDAESIQLMSMKLDNTDDTDYSLDEWHTDITPAGTFGEDIFGYTKITLDNNPDDVHNYYARGTNTLTCLNLANDSLQVETIINADGLYLEGNFTNVVTNNVLIGLPVSCEYEFSKQYLKSPDNNNKMMSIVDGRTTVKWCEVYMNNSEYMELEVSYPGPVDGDGDPQRDTTTKTFSGNILGSLTIGDDASETGKLRSIVAARNYLPVIKLKSNTHKKATITGCSFELMLTSRLRGIR